MPAAAQEFFSRTKTARLVSRTSYCGPFFILPSNRLALVLFVQKTENDMKTFVVLAVFLFAVCFAQDKAESERPKTFKRLIPADVLRDFPGMCFASTRCATVEPGKTWELSPFCGRSTCVISEDKPPRFLELVEDCGPLPLANPKCKLDEDKTNKTAPFPDCCPFFKCEEGAKLEYPEIPTVAPVPEDAAVSSTPKAA